MFRSISELHQRERCIIDELRGSLLLEPARLVVAYVSEDMQGALQTRINMRLSSKFPKLKGLEIRPIGVGTTSCIVVHRREHHYAAEDHICLNTDLASRADISIGIGYPYKVVIHTTFTHLWAFLSEEDSPLKFVITDSSDADFVSHFRKAVRDRVADYAARSDCAAIAMLRTAPPGRRL